MIPKTIYIPDGYEVEGHLVNCNGIWYDISELTPIVRKSLDVCYFGDKSKGKSFMMSFIGMDKLNTWKELGISDKYTLYSNYELNIEHVFIEDLDQLKIMSHGCFLGDDLEKWIHSRLISNKQKASILEILLNLGKKNVDVIWSCKRPKNVDVMLRNITDYWVDTDLELSDYPYDIDEYEFKSQFLDFCCIHGIVYNSRGVYQKDEYLYDLEIYKDLYDTTIEIKDISKPNPKKWSKKRNTNIFG